MFCASMVVMVVAVSMSVERDAATTAFVTTHSQEAPAELLDEKDDDDETTARCGEEGGWTSSEQVEPFLVWKHALFVQESNFNVTEDWHLL